MTNRIILGLVVGSVMTMIACAARVADTYYGIETGGHDVVFVVDVSGSMEGRSEGVVEDRIRNELIGRGVDEVAGRIGGRAGTFLRGRAQEALTALAAAQRELVPAIRGLAPGSRFNVVSFGAVVDPWRDQVVLATEDARNDAIRFIRSLDAEGPTPARAALERAFEDEAVTMIFFLSDGMPTDAPAAAIIRRVAELNEPWSRARRAAR